LRWRPTLPCIQSRAWTTSSKGRDAGTTLTSGLDWWSHRLLVVPAVGIDPKGTEVRGYWYDYKGSGSLAPTEKRTTGLLNFIRSRLDATGTAVVVTNLREGAYETDGRAYLGRKRDARDIKLAPRPSGAGNAERLSELKTLRDRGLISEDEYQAKRRQILDRM
jgi:putative oligomerization/nucleic acid binding protein